jgi:tRNA-2-methylthio-N6-dimethylallyladenosine synthase
MINVFFKTYGCQANVADSEGLMRYLSSLGCALVQEESSADLIIINSCAVRQKAEQKMFSYIGTLQPFKVRKPFMKIGIIGCVASYRKQEMLDRFVHVSFVFGAREDMKTFQAYLFDLIVNLETLKQLFEDKKIYEPQHQDRDIANIVARKKLVEKSTSALAHRLRAASRIVPDILPEARKAFINIMTGCNNYCSFCIVPFTRGREKSYPLHEIVHSVELEVQRGAREITLIGQNVNSYKDPETGKTFADLLEAVALIPGTFWIRYVSPHPKDMTRDVLEVMARYSDKLAGWIHMPLQSGSNRILERMNRPYTVEHYMNIIAWIREFLPSITITTDIIVGFPGEEDDDYRSTRSVIEAVRYDMIYSFIYSKRKYTKAYAFEDNCPDEVKKTRLEELQERQKQICHENNARLIGTKTKILVEKRLSHDKLLARTAGNVRVICNGSDSLIGTFQEGLITHAGPVNLECSLTL